MRSSKIVQTLLKQQKFVLNFALFNALLEHLFYKQNYRKHSKMQQTKKF